MLNFNETKKNLHSSQRTQTSETVKIDMQMLAKGVIEKMREKLEI